MSDQQTKPRFNIPILKFVLVWYVLTWLMIVLFIELNRDVFLETLELVKPPQIPFIILKDLPTWARLGVYFIGGLAQFLVLMSFLLLIRYFLSPKYKRYLTWSKAK